MAGSERVTRPASPSDSPVVGALPPGTVHDLNGQPSRKWLVLVAVLLGNFAAGFVFTLLSVARATIADDLHTSTSVVLWAFTGPTLAGAVVGPAWGRLGDLIGQKKLYLMSLFAGAISSVLVALSWSVGALIGFRTVSAMIGAAIAPSSLAIIFKTFGREERV